MMEEKKQEEKPGDDIEQYIKLKLYPIPYVNDKGYRIGNYHIEFDTRNNPLPFSSFDQVDHFLINLFNYAKKVPNKDKNLTTEQFNKKFFKHHTQKVVLFKPIKYRKQTEEEAEAEKKQNNKQSNGGRKTKNYRPKKRKSKSITPFCIENAKCNVAFSLKSANKMGRLDEKMCKNRTRKNR